MPVLPNPDRVDRGRYQRSSRVERESARKDARHSMLRARKSEEGEDGGAING